MIRNLCCTILLILAFTSCGSSSLMQKSKAIELGMSRKEVTDIMGNGYKILAARVTPEGNLETIRYNPILEYSYVFSFLDNRLVEWFQEIPPTRPHVNQEQ